MAQRRRAWRVRVGKSRKDSWGITLKYTESQTRYRVQRTMRNLFARAEGHRTFITPIHQKLSTVVGTNLWS